jgi:8-oxo-dGTP pyrophosphatase MutT (NUDIX family)
MTQNDGGRSAWQAALASSRVSVRAVTDHNPFCAGVLIVRGGRLLCTLGSEGLPAPEKDSHWRVGGVGGGQEPGEDIWQCALREALEELGNSVRLVPSPVTYMHDLDTNELTVVQSVDAPAPFCLQRLRNADPAKPFRPDLPCGPFTYYGLFLAHVGADAELRPGDDAELLLDIPLSGWQALRNTPTLRDVLAAGADVIATREVDPDARLWLPPKESLATIAPLLARHPELEALLPS